MCIIDSAMCALTGEPHPQHILVPPIIPLLDLESSSLDLFPLSLISVRIMKVMQDVRSFFRRDRWSRRSVHAVIFVTLLPFLSNYSLAFRCLSVSIEVGIDYNIFSVYDKIKQERK